MQTPALRPLHPESIWCYLEDPRVSWDILFPEGKYLRHQHLLLLDSQIGFGPLEAFPFPSRRSLNVVLGTEYLEAAVLMEESQPQQQRTALTAASISSSEYVLSDFLGISPD